jgi:16S rRNA processing protein RimM
MERWIAIGRIGRAKGLRGEVRVEVYNPESHILEKIRTIAAGTDPNDLTEFSIRNLAQQAKSLVVSFDHVETREAAEGLTGRELFVRRSELPELPEGEYYWCDLIGCEIVSESGERLGTLRKILPTPANDIYVIDGPGGETLLPAIPEVVIRAEVGERRIVVRPPEVVDAL